ncbi:MAG: hypothetical protein AAED33_02795 [Paracoccaceae bacterium]|jgi:Na+/melibiose symporter-like transporter
MLDRLASGGLVTVLLITFLLLGYARVLRAPRKVYIGIAVLAMFAVVGSQFLPQGHIFRVKIAGSFGFWGRALLWAAPVFVYGLLIRWIRKKTRRREGNDGS